MAAHPAPGRLVDIGGRRLHLMSFGDAPGPTVVIEQGAGGAGAWWLNIAEALSRSARVVVYDRAGYGWSDAVRGARTMEARVEDLARLLDAAGVTGPCVLVGHSYGGPLITLFAAAHPERLAGLVYADTPDLEHVFGPQYTGVLKRIHQPMTRAIALASRLGVFALFPGLLSRMLPPTLPQEARDLLAASRRTSGYEAGADDIRSLLRPTAASQAVQAPGMFGDTPLAVISHTVRFPPPFDALEEGFEDSQARLLVLSSDSVQVIAEGAGHMVQLDSPDLVAGTIARVHAAARDGLSLRTGASRFRGVA